MSGLASGSAYIRLGCGRATGRGAPAGWERPSRRECHQVYPAFPGPAAPAHGAQSAGHEIQIPGLFGFSMPPRRPMAPMVGVPANHSSACRWSFHMRGRRVVHMRGRVVGDDTPLPSAEHSVNLPEGAVGRRRRVGLNSRDAQRELARLDSPPSCPDLLGHQKCLPLLQVCECLRVCGGRRQSGLP